MFGTNLFVDEIQLAHAELMTEMLTYVKFFTKAKKALSKLPVQTKVWTSAWHNDLTFGGIRFEVYDNIGRTIGLIQVTVENNKVVCDYIVTRNKLKNYTEWVKYLSSSIKKFYKDNSPK